MENDYRGYWWLPDKPDVRIHGTLHISKSERTILDLDGSLIDVKPFTHGEFNPDIILGHSTGGTLLTLYQCIQLDVSVELASGLTASKLLALSVFVGVHFDQSDKIRFKNVQVDFNRLNEWVGFSSFDIKHKPPGGIEINYSRPAAITAHLNDLQIGIEFGEHTHYDFRSEVGIRRNVFFNIQMDTELPIEKFQDIIYHLQNFLSLALEEATHPLTTTGLTDQYMMDVGERRFRKPIEIAYRYARSEVTETRGSPLFYLAEIREQFETLLRNWFAKLDKLEPVVFGYFGPLYYPQMYLEQKFLGYSQAIESYHRRFIDGLGIPDDQYGKIVPEIMKLVPEDYKDWFAGKLRNNEPFLRRRLKELIDTYSWMNFGGEKFINDVVVTRNYLTHPTEDDKANAKTGQDLFWLTENCRLLVKIILLTELGLAEGQIQKITKRIVPKT